MAQKGLWNLVREKVLRERGALPKEEGDATRKYKALHEEIFLSSWLRVNRRREGEKEGKETVTVKRRCVGSVSEEAFDFFSQGRDLESCGDLSWETFLDKPENLSDRESEAWVDVCVLPDVTDVLVSPSSVVTELCDVSPCCSDWEFVEPQSFSFSQKRSLYCTVAQEEMRNEGSPVKAHPLS